MHTTQQLRNQQARGRHAGSRCFSMNLQPRGKEALLWPPLVAADAAASDDDGEDG